MVGPVFAVAKIQSVDQSCLVPKVHAGADQSVADILWVLTAWHQSNTTAGLSVIANHVRPFVTTVYHLL